MDDFNFGYETELPCCVCGDKPAQIEPRFGYPACIKCCHIGPTKISEIRIDKIGVRND